MKFVVVGTGGVGGYFGGTLAQKGENVWFIARGQHLKAMQERGLEIKSGDETFVVPPGKMTDNPAAIGKADVVLFCVKTYDTESAGASLAPMLTKDSIIINLQNGIDNEAILQHILPAGTVYGGVAYVYATITGPGVITRPGGPKRIIFGPMQPHDDRGEPILDVMERAGIEAKLTDDIQSALWTKFIFISAVGGVTALTRLTLGEILGVSETKQLLTEAMKETESIARALKVSVRPDIIERMFETLKTLDNNTYSSMYHDLVNAKPIEVEAFSGTLLRYGKQLGIPTPTHKVIYATLLPYHLKHSKARI